MREPREPEREAKMMEGLEWERQVGRSKSEREREKGKPR